MVLPSSVAAGPTRMAEWVGVGGMSFRWGRKRWAGRQPVGRDGHGTWCDFQLTHRYTCPFDRRCPPQPRRRARASRLVRGSTRRSAASCRGRSDERGAKLAVVLTLSEAAARATGEDRGSDTRRSKRREQQERWSVGRIPGSRILELALSSVEVRLAADGPTQRPHAALLDARGPVVA